MGRFRKNNIIGVKEYCRVQTGQVSLSRNGGAVPGMILRAVVVMVVSWTTLYTLLQGMDVSCDYFLLAVVGLVAAIGMLVACNLRSAGLGQIACFLIMAMIMVLNWQPLLKGLETLINTGIFQLNRYYADWNLSYVQLAIDVHSPNEADAVQTVLFCAHGLYTLILMLVNQKTMHPAFTVLGPVLVLLFVLNIGVTPAPTGIILFLLSIFSMFIVHASFQGDGMLARRIEPAGIVAACVVIASVTITSVAAQKGDTYSSATLLAWQDRINTFVNDMTWESFANLFASRGSEASEADAEQAATKATREDSGSSLVAYLKKNQVELGKTDSAAFSGEQALQVYVPKGEERDYYLKNYMGNVYKDNSWKHQSVQYTGDASALIATAVNLKTAQTAKACNRVAIYETTMIVKTYFDGDFVMPEYMSDTQGVTGASFDSEGYPQNTDALDDTISFSVRGMETYGSVFANGLPASMQSAAATDDYPGSVYLTVPDTIEEAIEENLGELAIQVDGESYVANAKTAQELEETYGLQPFIDYITDYLGTMEYSLYPGACPEGEDFVVNFLFEKKKGYCMHFATAATFLFRQMGIPARYVSGYVVHGYDFNAGMGENAAYAIANVTDYNAHAWVEIYEAGLGWVPVEVTVGFGNDMERESETKEVQTTTKKQTQQTTKKKEVQTTTTTNAVKKTEETKTSLQLPWKWLGILLVVVLLPLLLWYGICCYGQRMRKPGRLSRNLVRMENRLYGILLEDGVHWDCTDSSRLLMAVTARWGEAVAELLRQFQTLSDYYFYSETGIPYEKKLEMERLARTMIRIVKPKLSRRKQVIIHMIWCMD